MIEPAVIEANRPVGANLIAAVVTTCTRRKRVKPALGGTVGSLCRNEQAAVMRDWLEGLAALPAQTPASDLYAGRSFSLAKKAAALTGSPLFVVSAGLGLISADTRLPSYGLTVSKGNSESVASKVAGRFDATSWFSGLLGSELSTSWTKVAGAGDGRVLLALTRPYAEMVSESLGRLDTNTLSRLRIFGTGLKDALPLALRQTVMPYDDRLNALLPGTRSDFAQRAMVHFVQSIAHLPLDRSGDAVAVASALAKAVAPVAVKRVQRTDAELLAIISGRLGPGASASRLLRQLRDEDGIACEQGRFGRLFREAIQRKGAS